MDASELLTQLIGVIGMVAIVSSFWFKRRRAIIVMQIVGSFSFGVHFLLLGALTAAGVNIIAVLRNILFAKYNSAARPIWPLLLVLAVGLSLPILLWNGHWVSLLPVGALLCGTIGLWARDEQKIRLRMLAPPPLWIVHNVIVGSIPGVVNELVVLVSIVASWLRHRRR